MGKDGCVYGRDTRMITKENRIFVSNMKEVIVEIKQAVLDITNHYSKRVSWKVVVTISSLASLCSALIVRAVYG